LLVRKRIPIAAGLGGGSSDAAATLRLLNRLWALRIHDAELRRLAGALGSDVPLFLIGGAVAVAGRGEQVRRLANPPRFWLALACPPSAVPDKTRALYAALGPTDWTDGRRTSAFAERRRSDRSIVAEMLPNAFDRAADETYPGFAELRRRLSAAAGVPMRLTGAGPTLYALFASRHKAASAAHRMAEVGLRCYVACSVGAARIVSIVGEGRMLS
jgi:4-diphosphocytidyl-2-C-methyl-D-erythritol kinase